MASQLSLRIKELPLTRYTPAPGADASRFDLQDGVPTFDTAFRNFMPNCAVRCIRFSGQGLDISDHVMLWPLRLPFGALGGEREETVLITPLTPIKELTSKQMKSIGNEVHRINFVTEMENNKTSATCCICKSLKELKTQAFFTFGHDGTPKENLTTVIGDFYYLCASPACIVAVRNLIKASTFLARACQNQNCSTVESPEHPFKCCARCKLPRYCSRTCQEIHWQEHKKVCRKLNIARIAAKEKAKHK